MDRGYLRFRTALSLELAGASVTRARKNFRFRRLLSHLVDKSSGVQCDQTISLVWFYTRKGYPARLRRIRYWDAQHGKRLVFLTNHFTLPALTHHRTVPATLANRVVASNGSNSICESKLYGTSENAVRRESDCGVQLPAGRHRPQAPQSARQPVHHAANLERSLFEKMPIDQVFSHMVLEETKTNQCGYWTFNRTLLTTDDWQLLRRFHECHHQFALARAVKFDQNHPLPGSQQKQTPI